MFRKSKSITLVILSIIILFTLVACNRSNEEGDKPTVNPAEIKDQVKDKVNNILSKEDQDSVMSRYYGILAENMLVEDISSFIDDNIEGLSKENIELMIVGLEDYLSTKDSSMLDDYGLLNKYKGYVSDEMKSYLELLDQETNNIFTDGERLNIDIEEIMSRAIDAEKHLDKFPKGKIYNKIYDLYVEYIKGSILGTGNPYIFAEDGTTSIKQENLDKYKTIIENNKNSRTSEILSQYVDLLEKGNSDLNSIKVNEFYDKLDIIIEDAFINN